MISIPGCIPAVLITLKVVPLLPVERWFVVTKSGTNEVVRLSDGTVNSSACVVELKTNPVPALACRMFFPPAVTPSPTYSFSVSVVHASSPWSNVFVNLSLFVPRLILSDMGYLQYSIVYLFECTEAVAKKIGP